MSCFLVARQLYKEKSYGHIPLFGWLLVGTSAIVFLTVAAVYVLYGRIKNRLQNCLSKQELAHFFNGNSADHSEIMIDGNFTAFSLKYNKELYEIPGSSYEIGNDKKFTKMLLK